MAIIPDPPDSAMSVRALIEAFRYIATPLYQASWVDRKAVRTTQHSRGSVLDPRASCTMMAEGSDEGKVVIFEEHGLWPAAAGRLGEIEASINTVL